jgi:hypothetical protein
MSSLPSEYPFTELYEKRVRNNSDLSVIVSDRANRRGTGKTVFSLLLAHMLDRTEEGITKEKVAINPDELAEAYTELPRGSSLVLDEAEAGLSKYRAGSGVNMAMRELISMGRIEEKYVVLNLPASSELDRDLKALCSWWFLVAEKGLAKSHPLNWNPYAEEPRTPRMEDSWTWDDIPQDHDLREVYEYLTEEKERHLAGEADSSSQRLSASEVDSMLKEAKSEAETTTRNELLTTIYRETDLTQKELAQSVGLSRSRVADIVSG